MNGVLINVDDNFPTGSLFQKVGFISGISPSFEYADGATIRGAFTLALTDVSVFHDAKVQV
jgi:hypothetical protein